MKYPIKEDERVALTRSITKGMEDNPDVFPNPPSSMDDRKTNMIKYDTERADADQQVAEGQIAVQKKNQTLDGLDYDNKTLLDWAERITKDDDAKLKLLSWGARRPPRKLQTPTQPTAFEILKPFDGGGFFDWKEPKLGGKVSSYIVRRSEDGVKFEDIKTVIESEATLFDQPRGKKLWYVVAAINAAGESEASNTVMMTF